MGIHSGQFMGKVSFWNLREHYDHSVPWSLERVQVVPGRKCLVGTSRWCSGPEGGSGPHQLPGYVIWSLIVYSNSKAVRSNRVSHGHSPRHVCIFQRQNIRVIWSQRSKPRGWQWPLLSTRASSSGDTAPSCWDVSGGLGAGALVGSSTLGIGDGALPKEVGAMGPLLAPSSISVSMLKCLPSSTTRPKHLQSSCTAPQNTFGEASAWMACLWSRIASALITSLCTSQ